MKLLYILLSFIVIGCSNKINDFSILPDNQYNIPTILDSIDYSQLLNNTMELDISLKVAEGGGGSFFCVKNEGGLVIQTPIDKSLNCYIVGIRKINNELKSFYIRLYWPEQAFSYKEIPDSATIFTSLEKSTFKKLFPNHKGIVKHETTDTLKFNFNLYKLYNQDSLIVVSHIKGKPHNNQKVDEWNNIIPKKSFNINCKLLNNNKYLSWTTMIKLYNSTIKDTIYQSIDWDRESFYSIQLRTNKEPSFTYFIGISNDKKSCFYIRWKEIASFYKDVKEYSTVYTNVEEKYIRKFLPNHKGKIFYEPYTDTLTIDLNILEKYFSKDLIQIGKL